MKKAFIILVILLIAFTSYLVIKGRNELSSSYTSEITLIGASTNLKSLPYITVFANSTTTDSGSSIHMLDGGSTLTQRIYTKETNLVLLNIQAKGDTATSTLYVRQMGSSNGTNFFDVGTTTVDYMSPNMGLRTPTTTVIGQMPVGFQFDPGTATTTGKSFPFVTSGYDWTRFIIYADDLSTDPTDGVQAWITAVKVEEF